MHEKPKDYNNIKIDIRWIFLKMDMREMAQALKKSQTP